MIELKAQKQQALTNHKLKHYNILEFIEVHRYLSTDIINNLFNRLLLQSQ